MEIALKVSPLIVYGENAMIIGKCHQNVLQRSVLKQLNKRHKGVINRPGIGRGASLFRVPRENNCMALHTASFVGRPEEIGSVAVHVMAAALSIKNAIPASLELVILMPPDTEEGSLRQLVKLVDGTCASYGMEVIGGHTECTPAVNELTIVVTAFGFLPEDDLKVNNISLATSGKGITLKTAKAGDDIVMTKWAGLYGTAVIAGRKFDQLSKRYYPDFINETKDYLDFVSMAKDIEIAKQFDISVLYGIAGSGIFGALWEVAVAGKVGLFVDLKKIPLKQQTVEICNYYDINPYMLSGYGSMLIGTPNGSRLVEALQSAGIPAAVIGSFNDSNDRIIVTDDEVRYLEPPRGSELWRFRNGGQV